MLSADRVARIVDSSGRILLLALFLVPAQSLLWATGVPLSMKLAGVGVAIAAFRRPADGLLIIAALAPLGLRFSDVLQSPARGSEALVLAFLAGWSLNTLQRTGDRAGGVGRLSVPVLLFGAVVVTSCFEQLAFLQFQRDYPWPFVQALGIFFARDYLLGPGGFGFVQTALRLLEGLALFVSVVSICHADRTVMCRLTRALIVGAAGAALLSFSYVAMDVVRSADWTAELSVTLEERWTAFIGDVNSAGSYFVLTAAIATGAALSWTRWSAVWLAASLTSFAGLWLTGSRAAILSALMVVGATAVWLVAAYFRSMTVRRIVVLVVAIWAMVAILVFRYSPLVLSPEALNALNIRRLFFVATLGMVASRPLFGVGVGGYYLWSVHFSPPELLEIFYRENAHNYFLQIAGELGLVGLATFLWLLCAALWSAWPGARVIRNDPVNFGLITGVVAFLLTCLSGHPLIIPEVIYPFWIALGLAVGVANAANALTPEAAARLEGEAGSPAQHLTSASTPARRWVVVSLVVFLCASIPARVAREISDVDLTRVAYGFHAWEEDQAGTRFRWSGRRARLHVSGEARTIELPLRGRAEDAVRPLDVDLFLDGQPTLRMQLTDDSWQYARLEIPAAAEPKIRRIDLYVGRTFVPRNSISGSTDARELGVQVGEVAVAAQR